MGSFCSHGFRREFCPYAWTGKCLEPMRFSAEPVRLLALWVLR